MQSVTQLPLEVIGSENSSDVPAWRDGTCAGIDEVGIGPLAGPVVAAAVLLDPDEQIDHLTDSKKLSEKKREALAEQIKQRAIAWGVGWASVQEVDEVNVLAASHLAMQRACNALSQVPASAYVDGNKTPQLGIPCVAVVKGDQLIPQISAASIIAKVTRDAHMCELDERYPGYGFARHKGYPTKMHLAALAELGVTPVHRRSFGPVQALLNDDVVDAEEGRWA